MFPYRCPVCGGKGFVPSGFYSVFLDNSTACPTLTEKCRSCNGSGIVWGEKGQEEYAYSQYWTGIF